MSNDKLSYRCPRCNGEMLPRLARSYGLVVCELQFLQAMKELQAEADAGRSSHRDGGTSIAIMSLHPRTTQKFAECSFCPGCALVVIAKADVLPDEDIPSIVREDVPQGGISRPGAE